MLMQKEIKEFLRQSNAIESEYSSEALKDSFESWNYLISKDNLTIFTQVDYIRVIEQFRNE